MGSMRFRKSKSLGGGVKLNFSKKSVGISVGGKGFRTSVNSSGRKTNSVSIPGTGLSYVSTGSISSSSKMNHVGGNVTVQTSHEMPVGVHGGKVVRVKEKKPVNKLVVAIIILFIFGFSWIANGQVFGLILLTIAVGLAVYNFIRSRKARQIDSEGV